MNFGCVNISKISIFKKIKLKPVIFNLALKSFDKTMKLFKVINLFAIINFCEFQKQFVQCSLHLHKITIKI